MKYCDDEYGVLANNLYIDYSISELERIKTDRAFIQNRIEKELMSLDYEGPFLDCILSIMYASGDRMLFVKSMRALSKELSVHLDMEKLSKEIDRVIEEFES